MGEKDVSVKPRPVIRNWRGCRGTMDIPQPGRSQIPPGLPSNVWRQRVSERPTPSGPRPFDLLLQRLTSSGRDQAFSATDSKKDSNGELLHLVLSGFSM